MKGEISIKCTKNLNPFAKVTYQRTGKKKQVYLKNNIILHNVTKKAFLIIYCYYITCVLLE